jgi:acyl-CoA thioesterase FadM
MPYFGHAAKGFFYRYVVKFSDIDQFKHMSFANYLKLMCLSSDALFLPYYEKENIEKNRLKITDMGLKFKRQTEINDCLLIHINASEIEGVCFSLTHIFTMEISNEVVAVGFQKYQAVSTNGQPQSELNAMLENILKDIYLPNIELNNK